jgi:hypothetical protein
MNGFVWLANPMVAYASAALGIALCVALFVGAKAEIRAAASRAASREGQTQAALEEIRSAVASLRDEFGSLERQASVLVPPQPPRSGLNLSARSQALRLHRRGESPDFIAAALQIPRSEVVLLVKVHQILIENL